MPIEDEKPWSSDPAVTEEDAPWLDDPEVDFGADESLESIQARQQATLRQFPDLYDNPITLADVNLEDQIGEHVESIYSETGRDRGAIIRDFVAVNADPEAWGVGSAAEARQIVALKAKLEGKRTFGEEIGDDFLMDALAILPFSPLYDWEKKGYAEAKRRLRESDYEHRYAFTPMGGYTTVQMPTTREELLEVVRDYELEQARGQTIAATVAKGAALLPGYIGEFAAGGALTRSLGLAGTLPSKAPAVVRIAKAVGSALTQAGITTSIQPHRVTSALVDQEMRGESGMAAFAKAYGSVYIENLTELTGESFNVVGKSIIDQLPMGAKLFARIQHEAARRGIDETALMGRIMKKGGWNGILGEIGEERLNTILSGMFAIDDFGGGLGSTIRDRVAAGLKQDLEAENLLVETLILSTPGGVKILAKQAQRLYAAHPELETAMDTLQTAVEADQTAQLAMEAEKEAEGGKEAEGPKPAVPAEGGPAAVAATTPAAPVPAAAAAGAEEEIETRAEDEFGAYRRYGDAIDPSGSSKRLAKIPDDQYVALYHATSRENAEKILQEGYQAKKSAFTDTPPDYVYLGGRQGLGTYLGQQGGTNPVFVVFKVRKSDLEPDAGSDWKSYLKQYRKDVKAHGWDPAHPTAIATYDEIGQVRAHKSKVEAIGIVDARTGEFIPKKPTLPSAPAPVAATWDLQRFIQDFRTRVDRNPTTEEINRAAEAWEREHPKPILPSAPVLAAEPPAPSEVVTEPPAGRKPGISRAAERIQEEAIAKDLTESLGELPTYETMSMAEQARMAAAEIDRDYENAKQMAYGKVAPPSGLRPASIYRAVAVKARTAGDVETLRNLAVVYPQISLELTALGQEIKAADVGTLADPVRAMQDLQKSKEKAVAKRRKIKDVGKWKKQAASEAKAEIKKATHHRQSWTEFVQSIKC